MSLPESLGRLRRVRRIGAGGFASVWLYRDDELDSLVAVKALADNWAQQLDVRERFLKEAQLLRAADSPHVVQVYDLGETDDETPYFVMSYADRGTISDVMRRGAPGLAATIEIVDQAARGVADLHASGVIHRDIKPPNLLVRSDRKQGQRLLVADLGVAKAMLFASGMTQVVGTPAYMAPEQADRGAAVDTRADVHALGAVAYHLLTGRPVREHMVAGVADAEPPAPPSRYADLPEAVDDAVLRAVRPDREDRWPDPGSFAEALRRAGGTRTRAAASTAPSWTGAGGSGTSTPPLPPSKRRRWPVVVAAAVSAAVIATGGYLFWPDGDSENDATGGTRNSAGPGGDTDTRSSGDSGTPDTYCGVLRRTWPRMTEIGSEGLDDVDALQQLVSLIHRTREAAPPAVEDDLAKVDDPFQRFVRTLQQNHISWRDLKDPDSRLSTKHQLAAKAAAQQLQSELSLVQQGPDVADDAKERCGFNLDEIASQ